MARMQRFGIIAMAILTACRGERITASELPGRYSMNRGDAKDVLIICADRRWIHHHAPVDAPVVSSEGSWETMTFSEGELHVLLRGYTAYWKLDRRAAERRRAPPPSTAAHGYSSLLVERGRGGKLQMIASIDENLRYVPIDDEPAAAVPGC